MKSKRKKPVKPAKALLARAETWQNMTIIAHAFVPHPDATKPYCAECGWPRENHLS